MEEGEASSAPVVAATAPEAAEAPKSGAGASGAEEDIVELRVVYAKNTHTLSLPSSSTVGDLKTLIMSVTDCPAENMKLMFKGLLAAPDKPELDACTLAEKGVVTKSKILVVGATVNQIMDAVGAASGAKGMKFADESKASATKQEVWATMPEHRKVLDKGKPADAMFAFRPGQDPLPAEPLSPLYAQQNMKVRLTFKPEEGIVIIGTKERTQRVPLASVQKVQSQPIPGHEEYHILCLQLGPTEKSAYYLYWVPAQYIASIKGSISLGGAAL